MKTKWKPVQFDPVTSDIYETWEAPAFDVDWEPLSAYQEEALVAAAIIFFIVTRIPIPV